MAWLVKHLIRVDSYPKVFGTSLAVYHFVTRAETQEKKMKMYRFVLYDENAPIMGTNVDEPNPQIDAEFWARFMEGNCNMVFVRCFEENENES